MTEAYSRFLHVFHEQVDPSDSGRVAAADAALFLKRSGLADLILGKVLSTYPVQF